MREYKFRGKGIASNEWYYGDLIIVNDTDKSRHYYIIADEYSDEDGNIPNTIKLDTCNSPEVDKETVGQYTGLKDKNGKEIYDGDIVKKYYYEYDENFGEIEKYNIEEIKFDVDICCFNVSIFDNSEVIGNTTDNSKLLREE